jgi:hypothetical protein
MTAISLKLPDELVAGITQLTRGGVYLARLDPAKGAEVGKLRPVVVLTDQSLLDVAEHLSASRKTLSKAVNGCGAITPEMSVRLLDLLFDQDAR